MEIEKKQEIRERRISDKVGNQKKQVIQIKQEIKKEEKKKSNKSKKVSI